MYNGLHIAVIKHVHRINPSMNGKILSNGGEMYLFLFPSFFNITNFPFLSCHFPSLYGILSHSFYYISGFAHMDILF